MKVCHLLLDLPLQQGSRQVINVDCRPEAAQDVPYVINNDGAQSFKRGKLPLQKYKERAKALGSVTYLQFVRCYDFARTDEIQIRSNAPARQIGSLYI